MENDSQAASKPLRQGYGKRKTKRRFHPFPAQPWFSTPKFRGRIISCIRSLPLRIRRFFLLWILVSCHFSLTQGSQAIQTCVLVASKTSKSSSCRSSSTDLLKNVPCVLFSIQLNGPAASPTALQLAISVHCITPASGSVPSPAYSKQAALICLENRRLSDVRRRETQINLQLPTLCISKQPD
jgi:hypothetical protein